MMLFDINPAAIDSDYRIIDISSTDLELPLMYGIQGKQTDYSNSDVVKIIKCVVVSICVKFRFMGGVRFQ